MDGSNVARAILYLRKRAGYTQKDLAERIGISDKAVSKWERGLSLPDISYIRRLAIILDTDTDSLLAGDVIHHEKNWLGLIVLDENPSGVGMSTIIYDKPLVYYMLSYFLLVGIKRVLIVCSSGDEQFIHSELKDGRDFGIEILCFTGPLSVAIRSYACQHSHVMLVYGRCFLYGVDLTRFLQKAISQSDKPVILALPKNGKFLTNQILMDENRKVVASRRDQPIRTQYDYFEIPMFFCPTKMLLKMPDKKSIHEYISQYRKDNQLYVEMLDRGFIEISVDTWDDVQEASAFVRIVQDKCGMIIYCLEEVAWRRGLISMERMYTLGERKASAAYGKYVMSLAK